MLREVLKTFLAIFTILTLVVLVQGYIKILQQAAIGNVESGLVFHLVSLRLLEVIGPIVPPTFFFSILYSLGRMYRDSEVIALSAGGVSTLRIFRAYLLAALPVALLVAALTLVVQPWSKAMKRSILFEQRQQVVELSSSLAGRFNEYRHGDVVFYVESLSEESSRLQNIFVQDRKSGNLSLIVASEGYREQDPVSGSSYIVLSNGYRYEGRPGRRDYSVSRFGRYALRVDVEGEADTQLSPRETPTSDLLSSTDIKLQSELQYRLMLPVAVLVFTLISVPLSRSLPRQGMYGGILLALLLYALFFNLQALSGGLMVSGTTPAWIGRWWVHLVILSVTGLVLVLRSPGTARRILKFIGRTA